MHVLIILINLPWCDTANLLCSPLFSCRAAWVDAITHLLIKRVIPSWAKDEMKNCGEQREKCEREGGSCVVRLTKNIEKRLLCARVPPASDRKSDGDFGRNN